MALHVGAAVGAAVGAGTSTSCTGTSCTGTSFERQAMAGKCWVSVWEYWWTVYEHLLAALECTVGSQGTS